MAVTNWTQGTQDGVTQVSRLGLQNGVSGDRTLFLKQFAGEVLTSFEEKNVAMPLHRVRTIKNGKSAQFPSIGTTSAAYHAAGTQVLGGNVDHGEVTVTVDELLLSAVFVPKIDEAMNHYEVRSTYSKEMGNALANRADKNIFGKIFQGATQLGSAGADQNGYWTQADFADLSNVDGNAATTIAGIHASADGIAGTIDLNNATLKATNATNTASTEGGSYTGTDIVNGVMQALEKFEAHNVDGEKFLVLTPEAYFRLVGTDTQVMNRDVGGNGSTALGQAPTIGGVKVLMSNHLPTADLASANDPANGNTYSGNNGFNANLKGMIFTKDAAATVKLLDLGVESEYQIDRQGTLMVAKYAMGHNVLRGKSCIALIA